jgi:uncharacterized protein YbaR (Trm112 family)
MSTGSGQLVCPGCGTTAPVSERFCPDCKLPLVLHGEELGDVSERHERARKIKPQLSEGELVKVAWARNQVEGEFIQGLLLEEGVPSMLRRSAGFDVPDFLAAGPRDVLVPRSGEVTAREVLLEAEIIAPPDSRGQKRVAGQRSSVPVRVFAAVLLVIAAASALIWLVYEVAR